MTVQLILLLVSSSLCYNYYDYYDDDYDNSQLQYASHDTQTVVLGSSFAVPCHGQETLLYHNDKRYEEEETFNKTSHSFLILEAREDHTGHWTCGDSHTHLAVIPGLERTVIILQDRVLVGRDTVLTVREEELLQPLCVTASSSLSSPRERDSAFWRVGSQVLNQTEVTVRLDEAGREHVMLSMAVLEVRREHSKLELECSLQGQSASVLLEVEFPPQFTISRHPNFGTPIVTQSSVTLVCSVDSSPGSEVFWEKDGVVVSHQAELGLEGVGEEDQGWYQCNANHKLGNYSSVGYYLAIKQPEEVNMSLPCLTSPSQQPTVMTPLHNISTTVGQNVTIYSKYCSPLAPLATFWSGPDVLIRQGEARERLRTAVVAEETETCTTVSLVTGEVKESDSGLYLLVVVSEAGAGQGGVWLEVRPGEERVVSSRAGLGSVDCDMLIVLVSVVHLLLPTSCYQ